MYMTEKKQEQRRGDNGDDGGAGGEVYLFFNAHDTSTVQSLP